MAINPALDQFPTEALAIGKMVASFGEIELLFGLLAGSALRNQNLALRAMYRIRSTGGRIDLADVLMRDVLIREGFQAHYEENARRRKTLPQNQKPIRSLPLVAGNGWTILYKSRRSGQSR